MCWGSMLLFCSFGCVCVLVLVVWLMWMCWLGYCVLVVGLMCLWIFSGLCVMVDYWIFCCRLILLICRGCSWVWICLCRGCCCFFMIFRNNFGVMILCMEMVIVLCCWRWVICSVCLFLILRWYCYWWCWVFIRVGGCYICFWLMVNVWLRCFRVMVLIGMMMRLLMIIMIWWMWLLIMVCLLWVSGMGWVGICIMYRVICGWKWSWLVMGFIVGIRLVIRICVVWCWKWVVWNGVCCCSLILMIM